LRLAGGVAGAEAIAERVLRGEWDATGLMADPGATTTPPLAPPLAPPAGGGG
jgi:hypothetical protein